MSNKLRIVAIRIGEDPKIEEMDSGLKPMQKFVGGWIERVAMDDEIDLYCNEEGLYTCEPNRMICTSYGYRVPINGDMFIVKHNEEGDTVGLTKEEAEKWRREAANWPESSHSLMVRYEKSEAN